jgi:hypothetical protein
MLGSHDDGVTYRKAELKTFVSFGVEDELAEDEIAILGSVLEFSGKVVGDIMVRQRQRQAPDCQAQSRLLERISSPYPRKRSWWVSSSRVSSMRR